MNLRLLASRLAKALTENPRRTALIVFLLNLAFAAFMITANAYAAEATQGDLGAKGLGLIGAGIAIGGACIGAGIAVYGATSAGAAAIVERPGVAIWILIFAGLGEGIAIWGFAIAIMILGAL